MTRTEPAKPNDAFAVTFDFAELGGQPSNFNFAAPQDILSETAQRLDVLAVHALSGQMEIEKTPTGATIRGVVIASLERECVASLERLTENIHERFELHFVKAPPPPLAADGVAGDVELLDAEEPWPDEPVDLGDLLVQQLALSMAPYPRKSDAESLVNEYGEGGIISPFAGLQAALKSP